MDDKLKLAVRSIIYRESGRATISIIISKLRLQGWTKLGDVDEFAVKCELSGFGVDHLFKQKGNVQVRTRTFVSIIELPETG